MREYEIMVITRADLPEDELTSQLETIQGWITATNGKVNQVDHWGRRRLAYPIAKQRDGYYVLFKVELSANAPTEIERSLRISENILRYLVVRCDE